MLAAQEQPDPPFDEHASVVEARKRARQLAVSSLVILLEGEPGTGRRTLASDVILRRSGQSGKPVVSIDGVEGLTSDFRSRFRRKASDLAEVVVHNIEALPETDQAALGALVRSEAIRLVGVLKSRDPEDSPTSARPLVPELDPKLGAAGVALPPLRERGEDASRWADFFLRRAAERLSLPAPKLTPGATNAILRHRWPGNLIELDAVMSRSLCLSASAELEARDLGLGEEELSIEPLAHAVDHFKKGYIDRVLAKFGGNRSQAARALGIDVRTMFRHLQSKQTK